MATTCTSRDHLDRLVELGFNRLSMGVQDLTPEVQKAIDDRSRMGVFDDMNKLMQMKAAMAMEKAAEGS